jgi:hypothetical protein
MGSKEDQKKNPVARLRERFYKIREGLRPSPELENALRKENPVKEQESEKQKKIASTQLPKRDLDIG